MATPSTAWGGRKQGQVDRDCRNRAEQQYPPAMFEIRDFEIKFFFALACHMVNGSMKM
jgi:hypothetical protein